MIKNYYWAMAVMAAFVAGTIATATPVFAPPPEDDGEGGWKAAIAEQQAQIDELKASVVIGYYSGEVDVSTVTVGDSQREISCDDGDQLVSISGSEGDLTNTFKRLTSIGPGPLGFLLFNVFDEGVFSPPMSGLCADFDPPHNNAD